MSYDPTVPERVWIRKFQDRYGAKVGEPFYRAFIAASKIVPYAMTSHAEGPDHRNYAVELETGGSVQKWADSGPFDLADVQSPKEFAQRLVDRKPSARLAPFGAAKMLDQFSADTMSGLTQAEQIGSKSPEFKSLGADLRMLAALGRYNAERLRSATYFALYRVTRDPAMAEACRKHQQLAVEQWNELARLGEQTFKPFVDTLRLKTEAYTWAAEAAKCRVDGTSLQDQLKPLDEIADAAPMGFDPKLLAPRGDRTGPTFAEPKATLSRALRGVKTLTVSAGVRDPAGLKMVRLRYKPLQSETDWSEIEMQQRNGTCTASIPVFPIGLMWCLEALDADDNGTMWPDFRSDIPYRVVDPWRESGWTLAKALDWVEQSPRQGSARPVLLINPGPSVFRDMPAAMKPRVLKVAGDKLSIVVDPRCLTQSDLSWLTQHEGVVTLDKESNLREPLEKKLGATPAAPLFVCGALGENEWDGLERRGWWLMRCQ